MGWKDSHLMEPYLGVGGARDPHPGSGCSERLRDASEVAYASGVARRRPDEAASLAGGHWTLRDHWACRMVYRRSRGRPCEGQQDYEPQCRYRAPGDDWSVRPDRLPAPPHSIELGCS